jgi:hypothetical protein
VNEDLEGVLGRLTPRGAPPGLRPQVLAAVEDRLQAPAVSPRTRRWALAAAALLLVSVGLNVWVNRMHERRLAGLLGPPPVPYEAAQIASAIARVSDAETGQWFLRRLAARRQPQGDPARYQARIEQILHNLQADFKEIDDEKAQEDPQVDRDRAGRAGGSASDCQRLVRLDYRRTV